MLSKLSLLAVFAWICNVIVIHGIAVPGTGSIVFKDFGFASKKNDLKLVAAGLRRKKVAIVEVDVYTVGVYVSEEKDKAVQLKKSFPNGLYEGSGLAIVLHFVRSVSTAKVVDAIVDALDGEGEEYKAALTSFKDVLLRGIGEKGVSAKDELEFIFGPHATLQIKAKSGLVGKVENNELKKRLANIYIGDKAVAPTVPQVLKQRYGK